MLWADLTITVLGLVELVGAKQAWCLSMRFVNRSFLQQIEGSPAQ